MKILADANIAFVERAFAGLGQVTAVPASALTPEAARDVDLLLTRSTVKLGPGLLDGSRARFVATATSGVDHVDQPWLAERGVAFASAHGSNANSVAEWFALALLTLTRDRPRGPHGLRVGVVGVGAVGSLVAGKALALGCDTLLCDPPLARAGGQGFVPLDALLSSCDVLTLHVPLETDGPDPTDRMIAADQLAALRPGAILINASRGEVVNGDDLVAALGRGHLAAAALDVFEREPAIDPAHVAAAAIATPHIAGHSLDAKVAGTRMILDAACAFFGLTHDWDPALDIPPPPDPIDLASIPGEPLHHAVQRAIERFYTFTEDDTFTRAICALPPAERGARFRHHRNDYPVRREFHAAPVLTPDPQLAAALRALGFISPG